MDTPAHNLSQLNLVLPGKSSRHTLKAGDVAERLPATGNMDAGKTQVLKRPQFNNTVKSVMWAAEEAAQNWLELPAFAGLPADVLARVTSVLDSQDLLTGDVLMRQDDAGDALYILEHGTLRVCIADASGEVAMERSVKAPAIVGEMALVTGERRSATVTAAVPSRVLRMERPEFERLCREHPHTAVFLTCLVGERLLENKGIRRVGKYQVVGRLGSGGVATVFEAIHPGLGHAVALKMLSHALVFDPSFADHFGREGRLVAQLNHDNIVRVLDTEEAYGTRFIVMEKLTGNLLDHMIKRGDKLPWAQVRRILIEIAEALAYSHARGLIHRDIKPANVFMTEDKRVKLLDFGIAVEADMAMDDDGKIVGTPYYMSPEQILGHQLDGRSDLYSLGVLAYELCAHELPFTADTVQGVFAKQLTLDVPNPRRCDPEIPEDILEFIQRCAAKSRDDRYATAAEAADALRIGGDLGAGDPVEQSALSITYLPSRRVQVHQIIREATDRLRKLRGVYVFGSHEVEDRTAEEARPHAPGAQEAQT